MSRNGRPGVAFGTKLSQIPCVMRDQAETIAIIERVLAKHREADVVAVCGELVWWLRHGRPPALSKAKPWLALNMSRTTFYRRRAEGLED